MCERDSYGDPLQMELANHLPFVHVDQSAEMYKRAAKVLKAQEADAHKDRERFTKEVSQKALGCKLLKYFN